MTIELETTDTLGVACLGITHPHTSGRVGAVQRLPTARMLGAWDDSALLGPFCNAMGIEQRSKQEILDDPNVHAADIPAAARMTRPVPRTWRSPRTSAVPCS